MTDQEGIFKSKDYDYKKYNVRSNISAEIVKGFTIDLQLSGRLDTRNKFYEAEPITRSIQMARPTFSVFANDNRLIGRIRETKAIRFIFLTLIMSVMTDETAENLTVQLL